MINEGFWTEFFFFLKKPWNSWAFLCNIYPGLDFFYMIFGYFFLLLLWSIICHQLFWLLVTFIFGPMEKTPTCLLFDCCLCVYVSETLVGDACKRYHIGIYMKNIKSEFHIFRGIYEPLLGAFVFLLWGIVMETALSLFFSTDHAIVGRGRPNI